MTLLIVDMATGLLSAGRMSYECILESFRTISRISSRNSSSIGGLRSFFSILVVPLRILLIVFVLRSYCLATSATLRPFTVTFLIIFFFSSVVSCGRLCLPISVIYSLLSLQRLTRSATQIP